MQPDSEWTESFMFLIPQGSVFCNKISKRYQCTLGGTNITLSSESFLMTPFTCYYCTLLMIYILCSTYSSIDTILSYK